jgi:hypothetical protein
MTVHVWADPEVGWSYGATWAGTPAGPVFAKVEIEFPDPTDVSTWADAGTDWGDGTYAWGGTATFVNIGEWTRSATVTRGRAHDLGRVEAGVTSAELDDEDRRFDPANTASPYHPDVRPMRRLRLTAVRDGVSHPVSTGSVEGWPVRWRNSELALVSITAADAFKQLALQDITASRIAETTSSRIHYLLDAAGWPAGRRVIEPGIVKMAPRSYDGTSFLAALQEAATAEGGLFFLSRTGDAVFHNRDHRLANFQASRVTLGGDSGLDYEQIESSYDDSDLANEVRAAASSSTEVGGDGSGEGAEVIAIDVLSQAKYGRRVLDLGDLKVGADRAQAAVDYQLSRRAEPELRFTRLVLQPTTDENLWPWVLGLELGDRVTVVLQPVSGDPITREVHVEQIMHTITPVVWETEWALSPADPRHFWQLDTNDSELDVTTRVGY